jgi:hypothetical protein
MRKKDLLFIVQMIELLLGMLTKVEQEVFPLYRPFS